MTVQRISRRTYRRAQRGNALVFALLGLVIGGIVLALGVTQFGDSERGASSQATISEINSIIGSAKENFGQYNYSGMTTAAAITGRIIPENLAATSTTAQNKYGGNITLVDNSSTTSGTALLTYTNIPNSACVRIVNGTHELARRVQVGGTDVKPLDGSISVNSLNTQCGSSSAVTIAWTIGRT